MNEFVGKTCPYCKTEFQENDDVVVCSTCDMPHHKDCWIANQGCTTFGCLGSIKNPDGTPSTVTATSMNYEEPQNNNETIYCTKCGSPNPSTSSFCSKCGNQLLSNQNTVSAPPHFTVSNNGSNGNPYAYTKANYATQDNAYSQQTYYAGNQYANPAIDSDVQSLIGLKGEYYVPKFNELKAQNKKTTWNWCSFLFAPYWFIYRKMYGYGAAILGGFFLLSLINNIVISLLSLAGYIVFGIYGNYIYMQTLEKKSIQLKSMSEPYKSQFIAKNSGTNTTATVLTIIGYVILLAILQLS